MPAPPGRCSSEISRRPRRDLACASTRYLAGFLCRLMLIGPRSPCASRGGSGLGDGWVPGLHPVRDEDGPKSDAASMELGLVRFGLAEPAGHYRGFPKARRRGDDSQADAGVGELTQRAGWRCPQTDSVNSSRMFGPPIPTRRARRWRFRDRRSGPGPPSRTRRVPLPACRPLVSLLGHRTGSGRRVVRSGARFAGRMRCLRLRFVAAPGCTRACSGG